MSQQKIRERLAADRKRVDAILDGLMADVDQGAARLRGARARLKLRDERIAQLESEVKRLQCRVLDRDITISQQNEELAKLNARIEAIALLQATRASLSYTEIGDNA